MLTEIKEREKQSLTSAELNVIDWINENEEKIPDIRHSILPAVFDDGLPVHAGERGSGR